MSAIRNINGKYNVSLLHHRQKGTTTAARRRVLKRTPPEKVALPTMEGIDFEEVRLVVCLEAQGNYTTFKMVDGRKIMVCKTLREAEEMIRSDSFVRVHRSHTINLHLMSKYVRGKGGYVIMEEGTVVNVSAGKKKNLMEAISLYF